MGPSLEPDAVGPADLAFAFGPVPSALVGEGRLEPGVPLAWAVPSVDGSTSWSSNARGAWLR